MLDKKLKKIGLWFVLLQSIIWVKCAVFFSAYGYGKIMPFNEQAFTQEAWLFDFVFHEGMHVGIGILALLFGKNLPKLEKGKVLGIVFIAVALHNVGYWLTIGHPNVLHSVLDFARDAAILFAFVIAGNAFERFGLWKKFFLLFCQGKRFKLLHCL